MANLQITKEGTECFITPSDNDRTIRRHFRASSQFGLRMFLKNFVKVAEERGYKVTIK